jgi:hypothetical protein
VNRLALLIAACAPLITFPCAAQEKPTWETDLRGSYPVFAGARPTGGPALWGAGRRNVDFNDRWTGSLGAEFGIIGLGDSPYWLGILGGPTASIGVRPWSPDVRVVLGLAVDFGRLPACKMIGAQTLCMRFNGVAPALSIGVDGYTDGHAAVGASVSVRLVDAFVMSASVEPSLYARAFW